ncbi:MAG: carbamoyltransferase [Dehalococcoidia bacterium]
MYVLGVNSYLHDSSAALIKDGRVVFAVEEERLSRLKKDARFPRMAIDAALQHAGISFAQLDAVAFGWNRPAVTPLHTLRATLTNQLPISASYAGHSVLTAMRELRGGNGRRHLKHAFPMDNSVRLLDIDHHASHAWSAYAFSGMDEALVIVMDGRGAREATTLYHGRGARLQRVKSYAYPNSLGAFYEAFTDLLGFERNNDEWKVMGLAAYGEPAYDLSDVLRVTPDGYRLDSHLICGGTWGDMARMTARFGPRRSPEVRITADDQNLAASVQKALEDAVFAVVREGVRLTGCRNLCIAGGVAMNSKANGRLLASGLVDNLFVQPAATDDGAALGAAVAAHQVIGAPVPRYQMLDAYLGPEFTDDEIGAVIATYKLPGAHVADVETMAAQLIADGHIVGWFQGRMEFGPRALGNRSILADPRRAEMKDRVNESVKFREGWRPFAPSCTVEAAGEYFDGCKDAPYMIVTFDVLPAQRAVIPAVTHADNTARVQTVSAAANPRYWKLIHEFARLTGVPVVMNTSFNLRGEPIVCSPKDAIRTFFSSGLDFLVMGNHVIAKDPGWRSSRELDTALARRE